MLRSRSPTRPKSVGGMTGSDKTSTECQLKVNLSLMESFASWCLASGSPNANTKTASSMASCEASSTTARMSQAAERMASSTADGPGAILTAKCSRRSAMTLTKTATASIEPGFNSM